ncbi:hypothetical protein ABFS83_09G124600 [Erythranthe nasuta]
MKMHFFAAFSLSLLISLSLSPCNAQTNNTTFRVGVILDADSLVGQIGNTNLSSALSDFYSTHSNYSTRIVLHKRDSRGQVIDAADRAINLLKDVQVDAIIGPQTSTQANFVIGLGDAANVSVISFSATSPSLYPQASSYFLQTAINDAAQVDAIAAIVKYFKWYQVVLIYEDSDYGVGITPYLSNAFQKVNARVSYRSIIPISATDDFILQELYKMKTMQTRVFVVHTTSALASRIFLKANEAEMISEGYVWIVTTGTMNLFYSLDSEVKDSMQGVLGVKPLVPKSSNSTIAPREEMSLYGMWAYDTLWALAMAAEKIGFREQPSSLPNTTALNSTDMFITETSLTGPKLHAAMLGINFEGLAGNFHLIDGKLESSSFQILNINGTELKEVGIWAPLLQNSSRRNAILTGFSGEKLGSILWPGLSRNVPKGWEVPVSGKKLIVGVPVGIGFTEFVKVERDPQTNSIKVSGLYIDLFDSVMAALPYAVRYEYAPFENQDGSSAGSYDDLSYKVYTGDYDAVVGDITIIAKRSKYVDFTLPIEESGVTNTQNETYYELKVKPFFLKPFTRELWLTAIAILVLTGVALWTLEHRFNAAFRGPPSEHVGLILYVPFMSVVFANRERIVSNSARLVLVVWIFVVLILSSTYTASLSARFTTEKRVKNGMDIDTLKDNGYKVGCRNGSFIYDFLKGLGFKEENIKTYKNPREFDEALNNGTIKAMFSRTPYTNLFLSKYCNKYMKVGTPNITDGVGFVFPRGSPLVPDVSRAIIKLIDNQQILKIRDRWIKKSSCNDDDDTSNASTAITLKSFKILFVITAGMTGTCLLVFLVSYLYENRDFIRRIFTNSGTTVCSKLRAISKHFDQRDPRSFRYKEESGNATPDLNMYQRHFSTVDPLPSDQETASENGSASPNPGRTTAAARH